MSNEVVKFELQSILIGSILIGMLDLRCGTKIHLLLMPQSFIGSILWILSSVDRAIAF
jgi:hypothetical protein